MRAPLLEWAPVAHPFICDRLQGASAVACRSRCALAIACPLDVRKPEAPFDLLDFLGDRIAIAAGQRGCRHFQGAGRQIRGVVSQRVWRESGLRHRVSAKHFRGYRLTGSGLQALKLFDRHQNDVGLPVVKKQDRLATSGILDHPKVLLEFSRSERLHA